MSLIAKVSLHVAPAGAKGWFGIRIRLSRHTEGVWVGQGWENKPEEAETVGAIATKEGWRWQTAQDAENGLAAIRMEMEKHGFERSAS